MFILIFILGAIIGSFLNVCIYRIPREESIVFPASHCTSCSTPLKWYNLIPVLSYIFQGGKCSYCGEKISPQYPFIELLNGLLYLILYHHFGLSLDFLFYSIVFSVLVVMSSIDFKLQIIPNSLNIFILISSVIYKILQYTLFHISPNLFNSVLALLLSSGLFLIIALLSKGGMGGGDIKLIGVLGFITGIKLSLLNIFLSFIFGAIISVLLLLFKIKERKDPIPFGPFIAIAFMFVVLWGELLISWYLNILI